MTIESASTSEAGAPAVVALLARRYPAIILGDSACAVHVLVGQAATTYRRRSAASLPEPPLGSAGSFVARRTEGDRGIVVGFEGALTADLSDLLFPEAPLAFVAVRGGAVVLAQAAALPKIEVSLP